MLIRISRLLSPASRRYPGTPPLGITAFRSLDHGDASNASLITVHSHAGTHLDVPRHFCIDGLTVTDIFRKDLVLEPTICVDATVDGDGRISPTNLDPMVHEENDVRALLVRTGVGDPDRERRSHDLGSQLWIDPSLPSFLRSLWPDLRLFGIDTLSVSSPAHRQEGHACHREFLCRTPPILLLEDLDLSHPRLCGRLWRLRLIPWIVAPIDGVPVVALLEDIAGGVR